MVRILVGTDAGDTPEVRDVMDLICEKVNAIESSYPRDAQELLDIYEELKILATFDRWLLITKSLAARMHNDKQSKPGATSSSRANSHETKPSTDGPPPCPSPLPTAQPSKPDYRTSKSKS